MSELEELTKTILSDLRSLQHDHEEHRKKTYRVHQVIGSLLRYERKKRGILIIPFAKYLGLSKCQLQHKENDGYTIKTPKFIMQYINALRAFSDSKKVKIDLNET